MSINKKSQLDEHNCLIIRCKQGLRHTDFVELYNDLLKMKQNGLMIIPYYCEVVTATKSCDDSYDPSILYLCDGQACGPNHICNECKHTSDITHAMNFEKIDSKYDDMYFEKE